DHQDKYSFIRGPCGVTLTGRAKCLGPPDSAKAESTILRDQFKTFGSSVKWKQISENCGIDFSDRLRCWYSNDFENYSYSSNRPNPVLQANGYTFKQISASGRFVCGILTDDSLVCLGQDNYGRKGDGSNSSINMSTPFVVDSGESYLDISVSNKAVCGVTLGNKLKCWGTHDYGNIGTGDSSSHFSPTWIDTSESYLSVETNSNYACGLTSAGAIKCWGRSMSEGGSFVEVSQPTTISAGGDAYLQISVTYNFGCGIRSDNRLLCWGLNSWNRLGTGNSTNSAVPVFSGDTGSYKKVFVDNSSLSCGITSTDTTKCWGGNLAGYSFSTPGIYPSPVFTTMSYGASPFYSRWLGLGSDGSLAWFYKPDRVPGIPSSTIYYEYVQSLVDK
ncbi:MAG: hypothetical protein KDD35_11385, partial [Bdellovibrionales bacterium]|nr:hypothetical protein [Bdellovibrionales bacterium]